MKTIKNAVFVKSDSELENYKVENYEVGLYNNIPSLYKMGSPQKLLILKNNVLKSVEL